MISARLSPELSADPDQPVWTVRIAGRPGACIMSRDEAVAEAAMRGERWPTIPVSVQRHKSGRPFLERFRKAERAWQ